MPKLDSARKQEIIDHLVGNCECGESPQFSQDDVEVLNKFELEDLLKLRGEAEEVEEPQAEVQNSEPVEAVAEEEKVVEAPAFNESDLPESVKEELAFARNMLQQKKDELIAVIVSNENCDFTQDELQSKDQDELAKLAKLATVVNEVKEEAPVQEVVEEKAQNTPRLGGHAMAANKAESESSPHEVLDTPIMLFN